MTYSEPKATSELELHLDRPTSRIDPCIYGHFAEHLGHCVDGGLWVGTDSPIPNVRGIRSDVVAALKRLRVPVLRWPGGCFADEYHWEDGVGPREQRPRRINSNWGGVIENNHFGTHEFMDLCEQIGAAPYVSGNVGSGTVQEMMAWIEYMTSDADSTLVRQRQANGREEPWQLPYFGVGNESWGCGGEMRAGYYADEYRRYQRFVKNHSGQRIQRIACGASSADYDWTRVLMERAGQQMDGLSLHQYTLPTGNWQHKGSATVFGEEEWFSTLAAALTMEDLIARQSAIMDEYDASRRVGLIVDEWGTWYDVENGTPEGFLYQQNSLRDALVAALHFNIFHHHANRVRMANIAQIVNVLQAVILTRDASIVLTPTYHAFEMYAVHQGAEAIDCDCRCPDYIAGDRAVPMVHATASRNPAGEIHVGLVNLHPERAIELRLMARGAGGRIRFGEVRGRILTATEMNAHNTFEAPDGVAPASFDQFTDTSDALAVSLPSKSLVVLALPSPA